jgi:hypothetical protein
LKARQCATGSESLQEAPVRAMCETVAVKPKWRGQEAMESLGS